MIKLRKTQKDYTFSPKGHPDVVFDLRSLSEPDLEQVNYMMIAPVMAGHNIMTPECVNYTLSRSLMGWRGVCDENGNAVPFDKENIAYLPFKIKMEIASEVYVTSQLSEDDKKK